MSNDGEPKPPGGEDGTSSSSEESDEEVLVESLVAGRSKRATAGNRMTSLLAKEGDDELELLFAEDEEEEDVEFEGGDGEDASDVQLDSSSDDEDQGPAANGDGLEGERELQKQDKAERRKKRKAQEIFKRPLASRKVKVDPTAVPTTPVPAPARPKKKPERISWLPTPEEGPVRSSSRKQTMQNKEVVHQRMQENEKRRRRQLQVMEAAAKRKEASKAKVMTQADRMAEAARTEKRNAKSLNRWEQTEKKRVEEQKARLAALHNRQLQGPVISWWSGPSRWVNGKLVAVGSKKLVEEVKTTVNNNEPAGIAHSEAIPVATGSIDVPDTMMTAAPEQPKAVGEPSHATAAAPPAPASQMFSAPVLAPVHAPMLSPAPAPAPTYGTVPVQPGFLDGIHYYASLHRQQQNGVTVPLTLPPHPDHQSPYPPIPPQVTEVSTRNLVILENIDGNGSRAPELQNHVLLRKRNAKLQSGPILFRHCRSESCSS